MRGGGDRDEVLEVRVPKPEEQKPKKIELSKTIDTEFLRLRHEA
jgi:hypothetical protein